jgi:hypothetical protein
MLCRSAISKALTFIAGLRADQLVALCRLSQVITGAAIKK